MTRALLMAIVAFSGWAPAQDAASVPQSRDVSGTVITDQQEVVANANVVATSASSRKETTSDSQGRFHLLLPPGPAALTVTGKYLVSETLQLATSDRSDHVELRVRYAIPQTYESLVISASALDPPASIPDNTRVAENRLRFGGLVSTSTTVE